MEMYQNSHVFSQGGELSQLTGGFPLEKDSEINNEGDHNLNGTEIPNGQDETMTSRAEAMCEENRQIHRIVELSLKQLEKKRISLINKEKALDEEVAKALEIQKRQSEQNLELQMNVEEWSIKYANELKERNKVKEKLKQVEEFIAKYEENLSVGIAVGQNIEESKRFLKHEFEKIKKKSETIQENVSKLKEDVTIELQDKAQRCKDLKDAMIKDRNIMIAEIQASASQNEGMLIKINRLQEEIAKSSHNKEVLTKTYDSVLIDHESLNKTISKAYQELNDMKTINASRVQHLKLQINTEENILQNLETKLKEKEDFLHTSTSKLKELNNLSSQMRDAVDEVKKRVDKKVKELDQYTNKKPILNDQANSLRETLKKYETLENANKCYKDNIISLELDVKQNTEILSEKQNTVSEFINKASELENKLCNLKENTLKLDKEIENAMRVKHELTESIKENKTVQQKEREGKTELNNTLSKKNSELVSEIDGCTLKLEEVLSFNENASKKKEEILAFIENCKKTVKINEDKLLKDEEEHIKLVEKYYEDIDEIINSLDKNEFFILEARPKQKELAEMLEKKEILEQEIKVLNENHQKKIDALKISHSAKIQEMDDSMEKHLSIMKDIHSAQEESTNKLKEEIKEEEMIKNKLENEFQSWQQKLKKLKNEEIMKRNKIAKMEKRQQKIMNEIKVTREDIVQAVTGRAQDHQPVKRAQITTPSSSAGSYHSLYGKVNKTNNRSTTIFAAQDSKQESTRKWIDSVPEEEYDYSEV